MCIIQIWKLNLFLTYIHTYNLFGKSVWSWKILDFQSSSVTGKYFNSTCLRFMWIFKYMFIYNVLPHLTIDPAFTKDQDSIGTLWMGGFIPYSAIPNTQAGTHTPLDILTSTFNVIQPKMGARPSEARSHCQFSNLESSKWLTEKRKGSSACQRGSFFPLFLSVSVSRSHYPYLRACSTVVICYLNCIWLRDYYLSMGWNSPRRTFAGRHTILIFFIFEIFFLWYNFSYKLENVKNLSV